MKVVALVGAPRLFLHGVRPTADNLALPRLLISQGAWLNRPLASLKWGDGGDSRTYLTKDTGVLCWEAVVGRYEDDVIPVLVDLSEQRLISKL